MPLPSPLSPLSPHQRRSSARSTRHVSFAGTEDDNEADLTARRSYPPTPTRFPLRSSISSSSSSSSSQDKPHWVNYLAFLVILAAVTAGLAADYALAKEEQTPFACHVPLRGNWEKCAPGGLVTGKVKKVLVAVRVSPEQIKTLSRVQTTLSSAVFPKETAESL